MSIIYPIKQDVFLFIFRIVSYDCINKNDYYTISPQAVIHTYNGEVEYLELERWEQEYVYHRALIKITIFAIFRKWKSFNVWRKNVRCKTINSCRRALQKNLFIVNAVCIEFLLMK